MGARGAGGACAAAMDDRNAARGRVQLRVHPDSRVGLARHMFMDFPDDRRHEASDDRLRSASRSCADRVSWSEGKAGLSTEVETMRNKGALSLAAMVAVLLALAACDGKGTTATTGVAGTGTAAGGHPDLSGREVIIAVTNAAPPFSYIDEATDEPAGWDYDTWNEICARLNCTPEFSPTEWDGMITALSEGSYDVAANGITITDERRNRSTSPTATSRWSSDS